MIFLNFLNKLNFVKILKYMLFCLGSYEKVYFHQIMLYIITKHISTLFWLVSIWGIYKCLGKKIKGSLKSAILVFPLIVFHLLVNTNALLIKCAVQAKIKKTDENPLLVRIKGKHLVELPNRRWYLIFKHLANQSDKSR